MLLCSCSMVTVYQCCDVVVVNAFLSIVFTEFRSYFTRYLASWRSHHEYWITKYGGEMKIVLYKDLVRDIDLFLPITRFFGYNYNSDSMRYVHVYMYNYCHLLSMLSLYLHWLDSYQTFFTISKWNELHDVIYSCVRTTLITCANWWK